MKKRKYNSSKHPMPGVGDDYCVSQGRAKEEDSLQQIAAPFQ